MRGNMSGRRGAGRGVVLGMHGGFTMGSCASERRTQWRSQWAGGRSVVLYHRRRIGDGNLLFIGRSAGFCSSGHYGLGQFVNALRFDIARVVTAGIVMAVTVVIIMNVVGVRTPRQPLLNDNGNILINGARVGLLFLDPKFRQ